MDGSATMALCLLPGFMGVDDAGRRDDSTAATGRLKTREESHLKRRLILMFALMFAAGRAPAEDATPATKSGFTRTSQFSGPGSVSAQLEEDDAVKESVFRFPWFDAALQPWFDFKGRLNERSGLQLGANYTALYLSASDAPEGAEDTAASGIVRLSGKWTLVDQDGDNPGKLVFSVDNRHRLGTDIPPSALGFEVGYLGIPGTLFSDVETVLVDFNWQQTFNAGRSGLVAGRFDPNDFMDVLGHANPWTTFQNLAILFNTSVALHDLSVGAALGHFFNDQWFGIVTANDANSTVSDIEFYEDGPEFYTQAELGWTPSRNQRYFKNVHVTGWHTDPRDEAGVGESWGFTAAANWTTEDKRWMPFARAGWSDGPSPLMNATATIGLLHHFPDRSDTAGIGANWGDPSDDTLREQYTGELFYRIQLAQNIAITPSVQLLFDPALNPEEDTIWIGGVRARVTL